VNNVELNRNTDTNNDLLQQIIVGHPITVDPATTLCTGPGGGLTQ